MASAVAAGGIAAGGGAASFTTVAPAVAAIAAAGASAATATKLVREICTPSAPADDFTPQQRLADMDSDDLHKRLHDTAKELKRKCCHMKAQQKNHTPRDNEEIRLANSLRRDLEDAGCTLKHAQGTLATLSRSDLLSWLAPDKRPMAAALVRHVDSCRSKLDTYKFASVHLEGMRFNPKGPTAQVLLLCDPGELQQFEPSHCRLVRNHDYLDTRYELESFDAVVIARPRMSKSSPSLIAQQLLDDDHGREKPLLWLLLGDDTREIPAQTQIGEGDLMLHGRYSEVSDGERLLSLLGPACSLDPTSKLQTIVEDTCGFDVIENRVQARSSPQCCQTLIRAKCCWSQGSSSLHDALCFLGQRWDVSVTTEVQHSCTEHSQPVKISSATGRELVTRNLEGKIEPHLLPSTIFEDFGCTILRMPFQAYSQLKEYAFQHPDTEWILPCERDGEIIWERARLHGVELSGPFVAHISLPEEDPSAVVACLAAWLVDVGVGVQSDFPNLTSEAPEILPMKGSLGDNDDLPGIVGDRISSEDLVMHPVKVLSALSDIASLPPSKAPEILPVRGSEETLTTGPGSFATGSRTFVSAPSSGAEWAAEDSTS